MVRPVSWVHDKMWSRYHVLNGKSAGVMPAGSCKILNQEMPLAFFWFNFLSTTFRFLVSRGWKQSKGVYQEPGQNAIHALCEKAIWRAKWQCWEDFFALFLEKVLQILGHHSNTLARPTRHKSYRFKNRVFPKKIQGRVLAATCIFLWPKMNWK